VGGRGSSKTTSGILLALRAATELMPGLPGIWTEPTYKLCHDVFLTEWKKIVPRDFYRIDLSKMIVHCATGTDIYVRSRNVDNPQKEVAKGPNYGWGINDEMAYKYNRQKWLDIDASIRLNTPYLFNDTLSTPKLGEYKELVESPGHNLVHATSFDNPFLPPGWAEDMAEQMGEEYMEQEILGRWVALSGRIWKHWSNDPWPAGNIHQHRHNHKEPYFLFFDLGVASSAWLIVQAVEPIHKGRTLWDHDPVWVVTAEYMPKRDGSVDSILRQIKQDFGQPARVVAGADLSTRSSTDAKTANWFVIRHFGQVPTTPVKGALLGDKEIQLAQLSYGIKDTRDRRRFCVSDKIMRPLEGKRRGKDKRGIIEMTVFMPKEHRLEHVRDAAMYGAVACMWLPRIGHYTAQAA
jgi:hypothetical protein